MKITRGDIFLCNLHGIGSVQNCYRPCLVISNDMANKYSPAITVLPITSKKKKMLPTHVPITLELESCIMAEQILTIDKCQIDKLNGHCDDFTMKLVEIALSIQLSFNNMDMLKMNKMLLEELKIYQEELEKIKCEKILVKCRD